MPTKNTSRNRKGFGIFFGGLRDALEMSQREFAVKLDVSRSLVANVENGGTPPSATLIAQLITHFSDQADEIITVAQRYTRSRSSLQRSPYMRSAERRISSLLANNELCETRDFLELERAAHNDDAGFAIWASEQLSVIEGLRGNRAEARSQLMCAVRTADLTLGFETKLGPLWEQLAISFHQDGIYDRATDCLNLALEAAPQTPSVWYRKGLIQWDDRDLGGAYASLTVALSLRGLQLDALYARSQVSVELALADVAIADSTAVLENHDVPPLKESCMRCVQAYARFLRQESRFLSAPKANDSDGMVTQVFSDLSDEMDVVPDSPWPYYFRAHCVKRRCDIIFRFVGWAKQLDKPRSQDTVTYLFRLCEDVRSDLEGALERDSGQLSTHQVQTARDIITAYAQAAQ